MVPPSPNGLKGHIPLSVYERCFNQKYCKRQEPFCAIFDSKRPSRPILQLGECLLCVMAASVLTPFERTEPASPICQRFQGIVIDANLSLATRRKNARYFLAISFQENAAALCIRAIWL